jgi:hypothetical protein
VPPIPYLQRARAITHIAIKTHINAKEKNSGKKKVGAADESRGLAEGF